MLGAVDPICCGILCAGTPETYAIKSRTTTAATPEEKALLRLRSRIAEAFKRISGQRVP
jgi:hypothetical protein